MNDIVFYCSIIASMILYADIVSTIKKVKNNEGTGINTAVGCFCTALITLAIIGLK